jgi:hypothetical protein
MSGSNQLSANASVATFRRAVPLPIQRRLIQQFVLHLCIRNRLQEQLLNYMAIQSQALVLLKLQDFHPQSLQVQTNHPTCRSPTNLHSNASALAITSQTLPVTTIATSRQAIRYAFSLHFQFAPAVYRRPDRKQMPYFRSCMSHSQRKTIQTLIACIKGNCHRLRSWILHLTGPL